MDRNTDFERVRRALTREGEPDCVPNMELWVDTAVMERFLGEKIDTDGHRVTPKSVGQVVNFWHKAGYDYAHIVPRYKFPKKGDQGKVEVAEHRGLIASWEDFHRYPWPEPDDVDFGPVEVAISVLRPGMKLISGTLSGVFEESWFIMGFETFAMSLAEDPALVRAVTERVGSLMLEIIRKVAAMDGVGAIWHSDDIGHKTGTMISPRHLREYIFPWYRRMGEVCRLQNKPFIYHSDGCLWQVLDDLIDCGFDGLHPIEPLGMDIVELKKRYGDRLCLIGNIGLEKELTLGTPADVEARVKERIAQLAPGGGYACGSSNSVTYYVPLENYLAMLKAVNRYGRYPISS